MLRGDIHEAVKAAREGGGGAIDRLIEAAWPKCYQLAMAIVGEATLAQDVAQEACVVIFRKIPSLRDPRAFEGWLYKIVTRQARRLRRRQIALSFPDVPIPSSADHGPVAIDVWRALGELTPDLREVVVLFYIEDIKTGDIANILMIPHATVRTRLARARRLLRGLLDEPSPSINGLEAPQHAV